MNSLLFMRARATTNGVAITFSDGLGKRTGVLTTFFKPLEAGLRVYDRVVSDDTVSDDEVSAH